MRLTKGGLTLAQRDALILDALEAEIVPGVLHSRKYRGFVNAIGEDEAESIVLTELLARAETYDPRKCGTMSLAAYAYASLGKAVVRAALKRQRERPGDEAGRVWGRAAPTRPDEQAVLNEEMGPRLRSFLFDAEGRRFLRREYVRNERSTHDIAAQLGTYANRIVRALKFHGIGLRSKGPAQAAALKSGRHGRPRRIRKLASA